MDEELVCEENHPRSRAKEGRKEEGNMEERVPGKRGDIRLRWRVQEGWKSAEFKGMRPW